MGIDITCIDKSFSSSYGYWSKFRTAVIVATLEYLKSHFSLNPLQNGENSNESIYRQEIIEFIEKVLNTKANYVNTGIKFPISTIATPIDIFIQFCELANVNLLIHYGVGGLYSFCNKSDCEGFYSVGNSYDICELLTTIKPFIQKGGENDYYDYIDSIIEIFKESVEKKQIVSIC
jgi:hypothetical protein